MSLIARDASAGPEQKQKKQLSADGGGLVVNSGADAESWSDAACY